jgi:hypothetical protein
LSKPTTTTAAFRNVGCRHRHPILTRLCERLPPIAGRALGRGQEWQTTLTNYPVYGSLAVTPRSVFRNRALVVERFLPEREGSRYFMRHYLFLGNCTRNVRVAGKTPFLKRPACVTVDEHLPVPDELVALRRRLGFDYGKFDYTIHDGQVSVLDVNRTPGSPGTPEGAARAAADLADGIAALLPGQG